MSTKQCDQCGKKDNKLKKCARCRLVRYCGRECQRASWPTHKQYCRNTETLPADTRVRCLNITIYNKEHVRCFSCGFRMLNYTDGLLDCFQEGTLYDSWPGFEHDCHRCTMQVQQCLKVFPEPFKNWPNGEYKLSIMWGMEETEQVQKSE